MIVNPPAFKTKSSLIAAMELQKEFYKTLQEQSDKINQSADPSLKIDAFNKINEALIEHNARIAQNQNHETAFSDMKSAAAKLAKPDTDFPDEVVMNSPGVIEKAEFKSSSSNSVYTAHINTQTGESSCNCKGWIFKRNQGGRGCKHTAEMEKRYGWAGKVASTLAAPKPASAPVEIDSDTPSPMLAAAMPDNCTLADYISDEWCLEEKMDGHRILVIVDSEGKVSAQSRPGATHGANARTLPAHISEAFEKLPEGIYDGELYIPGGTSTDVVVLERQEELVFGIFDILSSTGALTRNEPYLQRRELLEELFWISEVPKDSGVTIVPNQPVSKKTIQDIWDNGGEGAILKKLDSKYRFGARSTDWIKVKKTEAATLTIVGFERGKLGPNSIAELEDDNGRRTTIKVLNSEILKDIDKAPQKYVGKKLVISYMGRTSQGAYKHAVWDHVL